MSAYVLALAAALGPYIWPCDISGINASSPCTACTSGQLIKQGASVVECIDPASVNVGTATALAANGANCSAGQYPLGVNASGAAESCTAVYYQTVENEGSGVTQRATVNFTGAGIDCTDSGGKTVCDVAGGASGGWTDDGTVVRLTTASDAVAIGTNSTSTNLEVYESVAGTMGMQINNPNTAGTVNFTMASSGAEYFGINYYGTAQGGADQAWAVLSTSSASNGVKVHVDTGDSVVLKVGSTDRATASSAGLVVTGDLHVDATTSSDTFDFDATSNFAAGNQFNIQQTTGNPTGGVLLGVTTADTDVTIASFTAGGTNGVTINGFGTLAKSGSGSVVADEVTCTGCVATSDILNNDVGVADLAASLAFADGDLISLASVNCSGTGEGLILPQATGVSAATAEGQISWDTDDDVLYIGTGGAQKAIIPSLVYTLPQVVGTGSTVTPSTTWTSITQGTHVSALVGANSHFLFSWAATNGGGSCSGNAEWRLRNLTESEDILTGSRAIPFATTLEDISSAASNLPPAAGAAVALQVRYDSACVAGEISIPYSVTWEATR